ncbi:MAG: response regulator [Angelakisella sp.]
MYLLIVDDDKLICENIRSKLTRLGYQNQYTILTAAAATDAEILYDTYLPQIVITDIHMPGVSGLTLIERLLAKPHKATVMVLSGYDDYDYVRKAFLLGATDYMLKPLDIDELDSKLRKLCLPQEECNTPTPGVSQQSDADLDVIQHALQYIQANISRSLSMREVAEQVGLSYNYFSKLFKETTHMNFSGYIHMCRIELSKKYLRDPSCKIQGIAKKMGYETSSEFSRAFKKYTGCYPTEYRESEEPSPETADGLKPCPKQGTPLPD